MISLTKTLIDLLEHDPSYDDDDKLLPLQLHLMLVMLYLGKDSDVDDAVNGRFYY